MLDVSSALPAFLRMFCQALLDHVVQRRRRQGLDLRFRQMRLDTLAFERRFWRLGQEFVLKENLSARTSGKPVSTVPRDS